MVASFRDSVDAWLEELLPADLYVRAPRAPATALLLRRRPGADRRAAGRAPRRRSSARMQIAGSTRAAARRAARARRSTRDRAAEEPAVRRRPRAAPAGAPPPVWVSEAIADLYGVRPGQRDRRCRSPARARAFTVAGVWRDYARPARRAGRSSVHRYVALTGDDGATNGALWLAPGADARRPCASELDARAARRRALDVAHAGEIRALSLRDLRPHLRGHLCAASSAAMVIGLVGLSSSFARAGARAAARVRHAAAPGHDAAARSGRDARRRGRAGQRDRARASGSRSAR